MKEKQTAVTQKCCFTFQEPRVIFKLQGSPKLWCGFYIVQIPHASNWLWKLSSVFELKGCREGMIVIETSG